MQIWNFKLKFSNLILQTLLTAGPVKAKTIKVFFSSYIVFALVCALDITLKQLKCYSIFDGNHVWAVVVAQLVEQSLPIPEVCGSNPVISKNLYLYWTFLFTVNWVLKRRKIKKKRPGVAHLKKHVSIIWCFATVRFLFMKPKLMIFC